LPNDATDEPTYFVHGLDLAIDRDDRIGGVARERTEGRRRGARKGRERERDNVA